MAYYRKLDVMVDSPVIKLNGAIALSKLDGPEAGLKALDESELQKPLEHYALFYAAKADMYFRETFAEPIVIASDRQEARQSPNVDRAVSCVRGSPRPKKRDSR